MMKKEFLIVFRCYALNSCFSFVGFAPTLSVLGFAPTLSVRGFAPTLSVLGFAPALYFFIYYFYFFYLYYYFKEKCFFLCRLSFSVLIRKNSVLSIFHL